MKPLIFYCGTWRNVPDEVQGLCYIPVITTHTGEQLGAIGKSLVGDHRPTYDDAIFTNSDCILLGLQVAVRNLKLKEPAPIQIKFYAADGLVYEMFIDVDGHVQGVDGHVPNGFFDAGTNLLLDLF